MHSRPVARSVPGGQLCGDGDTEGADVGTCVIENVGDVVVDGENEAETEGRIVGAAEDSSASDTVAERVVGSDVGMAIESWYLIRSPSTISVVV